MFHKDTFRQVKKRSWQQDYLQIRENDLRIRFACNQVGNFIDNQFLASCNIRKCD